MSLTSVDTFLRNFAKGKGAFIPWLTQTGVATTSAGSAVSAGMFTIQPLFNNIGTTAPGTLVSIPQPGSSEGDIFQALGAAIFDRNTINGMWLGYCYNIGTVDLTATGSKFTHDAGVTYPLTRTVLGAATTAINLIPIIYVTTALTVTAAALRLQTGAGGNGYVNQAGSNVVGTRTFTFPSATTVAQSAFPLLLEDGYPGDTGIQDILDVRVDTAATAGAARIFGWEPLIPLGSLGALAGNMTAADMLLGALGPRSLKPAAPTAGTLTSYLTLMMLGTNASTAAGIFTGAVAD